MHHVKIVIQVQYIDVCQQISEKRTGISYTFNLIDANAAQNIVLFCFVARCIPFQNLANIGLNNFLAILSPIEFYCLQPGFATTPCCNSARHSTIPWYYFNPWQILQPLKKSIAWNFVAGPYLQACLRKLFAIACFVCEFKTPFGQ